MPITVYLKANPRLYRSRKKERLFFVTLTILGALSIIFALYPYFSWHFFVLPRLSSSSKDAPIPTSQVLKSNVTGDVQVIRDKEGFSFFSTTYKPQNPLSPQEFFLVVPKLNIERAVVKTNNLNFYENLSHFPGSALPGEIGNVFITGHSVLPQFADPQNYRTIFTKLSDLEVGDDVFIEINDQVYHYSVEFIKVVDPHDTSVLNPITTNGRNLTLMTCVPPGTNAKRLIVTTTLI